MGNTNCDRCGHDKKMCDCPTYVAQEGGDHYQADYQHWDWVIDAEIGYLAGNATKYVSRWRKKNGIDDLKKALTYVDKMIATRKNSDWHYRPCRWRTNEATKRFVASAGLNEAEADIVFTMSGPCPPEMLRLARERLEALIKSAQSAASAGQRAGAGAAPPQGAKGAQQALRAAPTTADAARQPHGLTGMEHPFGYDATLENGDDE